jgi:hypothetical protein
VADRRCLRGGIRGGPPYDISGGHQPEPALTAKAVDTLDELLSDPKHPSVRLGAARTVADIGLHQYDADAIVRKLAEIEKAMPRRR